MIPQQSPEQKQDVMQKYVEIQTNAESYQRVE